MRPTAAFLTFARIRDSRPPQRLCEFSHTRESERGRNRRLLFAFFGSCQQLASPFLPPTLWGRHGSLRCFAKLISLLVFHV